MRTLIKFHRCKRHPNPLLRLAGWHCWRCRRAFRGRAETPNERIIRELREAEWPWPKGCGQPRSDTSVKAQHFGSRDGSDE